MIDGKGGKDNLKVLVTDLSGAGVDTLTLANVTNVENFFVRNISAATVTLDASQVEGEEQVWNDRSTANVAITNLGTGAVVGVKGNGTTNISDTTFAMAADTDAVSIALDGGVKDAGGAPTIMNSVATAAATTATISSTGAANTVGAVKLTGASTSVTALTVNAATNLTAVLTATDFAATATMTVTGAGKVDVGANFAGATIDASGNTGGLTVSTAAGVTKTLTGSSAADSVTLVGALAANATVNLGAGDDKLLAGAGAAVPSTATVDGGAGVDTVAASIINAANGSKFINFEKLDVSGATATALDVDLVTGSTITGLTLNGGTGGSTLTNVAAGVGLTVSGSNTGTTTIGVKGATAATATSDTFAVSFDGKAAAGATATAPTAIDAGELVLAGVETINVASTGTGFVANNLEIDGATALKSLVITGDKKLDLDFSQNVANNGAAVTATNGLGVAEIDGSAATGALDINTANIANIANAGLTVKTGAGKDVITLAQKATVEAGAGDDVITTSVDGGTLTGGAGADTFDIDLAVATAGNLTEATGVFKTIINDFGAGDKITFDGAGTGFVSNKVALDASVTNLDLALAAASNNTVTGQINWFQYGSDTYVVENVDGNAGIGAGDVVVKLAGSVDLSSSTYDATNDILSFA